MLDTNGVLLVLLCGLVLALFFAVRSLMKKNGFTSKMIKGAKRWKTLVDQSSAIGAHLESLTKSFAGESGLLVRTAPWGEFQTVVVITKEGPLWFPIGNLSHVSTHVEYGETDEQTGEASKKYHGVLHMKNGCFYTLAESFDESRGIVSDARIGAFNAFSKIKKSEGLDQ